MCFRSEGVGNPLTATLTYEAVNMTSTPTAEVIRISLVAIKQDDFIHRPTSDLEYRFL